MGNNSFANNLVGIVTSDGWEVMKKIPKLDDETGGNFSVQYIAEKEGEKCFLKAIDIETPIIRGKNNPGFDFTKKLQDQMNMYNYEKDLLEYCKSKSTTKVVLIKGSGVLYPKDGVIPCPYLLFDLADGNVKRFVKFNNDIDFIWKLKSLHDIAVGIQQLHNISIIHQDIKPSNILQYKNESKLTDLGRSKRGDKDGPYNSMPFSGDMTYAPIEIIPEFEFLQPNDWYDKNLAMDSYLLGNLMTFYFSGLNMTALIKEDLFIVGISKESTFSERYSYLQHSFINSLEKIRCCMQDNEFKDDVIHMIEQLCNPDPKKRNMPKTLKSKENDFSLYRYITKLNYLKQKASLKLKSNGTLD